MTPPPSPEEEALSGPRRASLLVLFLCSLLSLAAAASVQFGVARMAAPPFGMRSSIALPAVLLCSILALPFFGLGVLLAYSPLRAAGRVVPGLRVLAWTGRLVFFLLATPGAVLIGAAAALWANDAPGVAATAGVAALPMGSMVFLGRCRRRRLEKRAVAQLLLAAPATDACWYALDQGAPRGPLTAEQLAAVACERWPLDTMVAGPTLPGWVIARQLPAFAQAPGARVGRPGITRAREESIGRWLGRRLSHFVRSDRPSTARGFYDVTFWTLSTAFCLLSVAAELRGHAISPTERPGVHAISLILAIVGVVLPAIVMVEATRQRLRELGQDERRCLYILIPGINVFLWFRLVLASSASDKADAKRR